MNSWLENKTRIKMNKSSDELVFYNWLLLIILLVLHLILHWFQYPHQHHHHQNPPINLKQSLVLNHATKFNVIKTILSTETLCSFSLPLLWSIIVNKFEFATATFSNLYYEFQSLQNNQCGFTVVWYFYCICGRTWKSGLQLRRWGGRRIIITGMASPRIRQIRIINR